MAGAWVRLGLGGSRGLDWEQGLRQHAGAGPGAWAEAACWEGMGLHGCGWGWLGLCQRLGLGGSRGLGLRLGLCSKVG